MSVFHHIHFTAELQHSLVLLISTRCDRNSAKKAASPPPHGKRHVAATNLNAVSSRSHFVMYCSVFLLLLFDKGGENEIVVLETLDLMIVHKYIFTFDFESIFVFLGLYFFRQRWNF